MLDIRQIELAEEEEQKVSLNNTLATTERGACVRASTSSESDQSRSSESDQLNDWSDKR